MTLRSKLPLHLLQKYFLMRESLESFYKKIEVIIDSNAIIYSIRILIVMIALLMGYMHTPKEKLDSKSNIEIVTNSQDTVIKNLNKVK